MKGGIQRLAILGVIVVLVGSGIYFGTTLLGCSEDYRNDVTVRFDNKTYKAERVDTEQTRNKGLSGRRCIGRDDAMLFVFEESGEHSFWMKDMKFSIDMIWLDESKKVVYVQPNAQPESYPGTFRPNKPARYVLEVPVGAAEKYKITVGTQVQF